MRRYALALAMVMASACSNAVQPSRTLAPSSPKPSPTATAAAVPSSVYAHIGPVGLSAALKKVTPRVYVPNTKSGTVDVIDPATMKVIDHFRTGLIPQHVTPSWGMRHLYVDNDASNTLTEIDPVTGKPVRTFPVTDPYNLYFTPDGSSAIVVAERLKRLDFRDASDWKVEKSLPLPCRGPNHLDFSADASAFLISCEFSGDIVKVDLAKREVLATSHIGGKPADVRLSSDGRVFFVANERRGGVSVIDPRNLSEVGFIATGPGAHGFVVSRDGRDLYVTNRQAGTVSVLDMVKRRVKNNWVVAGSPDMGGVSVDGSRLWLSGRYDGRVYVIDTFNGHVVARIGVGNGPHGLCVFPQPGRFSLGHTGNLR